MSRVAAAGPVNILGHFVHKRLLFIGQGYVGVFAVVIKACSFRNRPAAGRGKLAGIAAVFFISHLPVFQNLVFIGQAKSPENIQDKTAVGLIHNDWFVHGPGKHFLFSITQTAIK